MMSSVIGFFLLYLCLGIEYSKAEQTHRVLLSCDGNQFHIRDSGEAAAESEWMAKVEFSNTIMENGWSSVAVSANPEIEEKLRYYSMGYAEGYVTHTLIGQAWNNTIRGYCDDPSPGILCDKMKKFVQDNLNWMLSMIEKNPGDEYWEQINLGLLQAQGIADGYNGLETPDPTIRLKPFGLLLLQLQGDLEDLATALDPAQKYHHHTFGSGSCSALIKLVGNPGNQDLFVAHDTWDNFESMLRVIKKYDYGTFSESFSSYPGSIVSGDDFYILSSGIVTLETTIGNSNPDLWKYVTVETVPEWLRTFAANRLAKNGEEWCKLFAKYNSGTYNNQWMIADYNMLNKADNAGLLYIIEQLPGLVEYGDVSKVLVDQSYWASYNVPYFEQIFNMSGLPAMVAKFGDWFTHDMNPRARIFRRDHKKVTDIPSMINLMRFNDFKNDPLSQCNCTPPYSAENTIAARSDLNPSSGVYPFDALGQRDHGATDVKVTSLGLQKDLAMVAESGPTHDQQPVFQWSTSPYPHKTHTGHPDRFDFSPVLFSWE